MRSLREITPIDSIVMSILSKNTNPLDVASRIDNFLAEFRVILETMPQSELQDHAASVSKQLRKPIQSLGDEVSLQVRVT
jgi:secreted Zn-dependent insulinase-like peptidase